MGRLFGPQDVLLATINAMTVSPITLRLAHSPDPDDAFMWWPLFAIDGKPPRLDTGRFRFEPVMEDIETLNRQSAIPGPA